MSEENKNIDEGVAEEPSANENSTEETIDEHIEKDVETNKDNSEDSVVVAPVGESVESFETATNKFSAYTEKRHSKVNKKPNTVIAIVIAVCLAILIILAAVVGFLLTYEPENPNTDEKEVSKYIEFSTDADGSKYIIETNLEGDKIIVPVKNVEVKNIVNFLVLGKDREYMNTDVMLIASFNIDSHTLSMMQIPRDTYLEVDGTAHKANAVMARFFNKRRAQGMKYDDALSAACLDFKNELSKVLGFTINYYVYMDLKGFVNIVDAVVDTTPQKEGVKKGIKIDVPCNMKYNDPEQNLYINLKKGITYLDGDKAEQFIRFRKSFIEGDMGRVDTQKIFISAFATHIKENFNIDMIVSVAKEVLNHVRTDVPVENIVYYAREALSVDLSAMRMVTIPGIQSNNNSRGTWYYIVSRPGAIREIDNYYIPYTLIGDQAVSIANRNFDKDKKLCAENESAMYKLYLTDYEEEAYYADDPSKIPVNVYGGSYTAGPKPITSETVITQTTSATSKSTSIPTDPVKPTATEITDVVTTLSTTVTTPKVTTKVTSIVTTTPVSIPEYTVTATAGTDEPIAPETVTVHITTEVPPEYTNLPSDTSIYTTEEFVVTTEEPMVTTEEPVVTTEEPAVTTEEPAVTTEEPVVTTEEPIVTTEEPVVTTEEPAVTSEEPVVTTEEPVVTTEEPVVTTEEPVVTTEEPVVTTEEPVVTTAIPVVTEAPAETVVATESTELIIVTTITEFLLKPDDF